MAGLKYIGSKRTVIIIICVAIILFALVAGIVKSFYVRNHGETVKVQITDISMDEGSEIVYGKIISDIKEKNTVISYRNPTPTGHSVGDIVLGKYYDGDFIPEK